MPKHILQSFIYRHLALQVLTPTTLNPPHWPNVGRGSELVRVPGRLYGLGEQKDAWIHTLSIHPTHDEPRANEFTMSIRCLARNFTRLTQFACHVVLSPASFDVLTASTCQTLKHLLVTFGERVSEALGFFNRLSRVTDLSLEIRTNHEVSSVPSHTPVLPSLTRLDLRGSSAGIFFAALWLKNVVCAGIDRLTLSTEKYLCCVLLVPFFARQGRSIKTLALGSGTFRDLRRSIAWATALERIELWGEKEEVDEMVRFDLPSGEGVVVEKDSERGRTVLRLGARVGDQVI